MEKQRVLNDYAKAKESLVKYLRVCEKSGENKGRAYLMFGAMYETMANNTNEDTLDHEAMKYYRLAIHEAHKSSNKNVIINAFTNLVELCNDSHDILHLGKEYKILQTTRNDTTLKYGYMFANKTYLSSLYAAKGKYAKAIKYCDELIVETPKDIEHTIYLPIAPSMICKTHKTKTPTNENTMRHNILLSCTAHIAFTVTTIMSIAHAHAESETAEWRTPTFPTAEGDGKYATGGRGGDVYIVRKLNNSGEGQGGGKQLLCPLAGKPNH